MSTALAARIGGAAVLGEYSLILSTAGMVGSFVGTGVGTIALRYSALFPRNTQAYRKVLRLIVVITAVTAASAALLLFLGSKPLAHLALDNPKLSNALQFGAVAIFVLVLYEALNGVLVALHDFRSLLWLAVVSGVLTLIAVPYASQFGATLMVLGYSLALLIGLIAALVVSRRVITPLQSDGNSDPASPRAREIILFGNTQQFNTVVISLASWWVILLVTRYDPTLHQMGYYFIGSQLRQLVGQGPSLISQLVFPTLSRVTSQPEQHDRVLSIAIFFCAVLSLIVAGAMLITLPWILRLYGLANRQASIICLLLIATAVVHLGYFPAANALMMLSLRASAILNIVWSVSLVLLGYAFISNYGAVGGALAWLLSQLIAQVCLAYLMKRMDRLPSGTLTTWWLADVVVLSLSGLAFLNAIQPALVLGINAVQILVFLAGLVVLLRVAQQRGYLPKDTRTLLVLLTSAPRVLVNTLVALKTVSPGN